MIVVLQYIYAFMLFGGAFLVLFKGIQLSFRFGRHVWDVSRRFRGHP